jgi:hypothetical protein
MNEIEPSRWLRIVQTGVFLRKWSRLGLDDDDLLALEREILDGPDRHPVIRGTGGVRKIRFAPPARSRVRAGRIGCATRISPGGAWSSC